ncbi:MAG: MBL fold metallo-hydrolase [Bacteroidota bacterium]|nr:MBL fold metallo-hydrolase [Bacteroidota bacterium]
MNIKIWGCRGSIPSPGPEKSIYGSNTSCIQVTDGNNCIILDGGSGIQRLSESLPKNITHIDLLLTHLHLDHIIGLGFFQPFYNPKMTINIWGPAAAYVSLKQRLRRYFSPPLFPIRLSELPCKGEIFEIHNSTFRIGDFKITSEYICHPGPTVGYRLQLGKAVFTYIPDHEPALGSSDFPHNQEWTSGFKLARGADILMQDAQYKNEDYKNRIGWGHSSMENAIDFGELSGVKKLLLFHHDPMHTDEQLMELYKKNTQNRKLSIEVELAEEGKSYNI